MEISRGDATGRYDDASEVASLVIQARLVVVSVDSGASTMVALTDSVRVIASQAYARSSTLQGARGLQGTALPFRVAHDGSTAVLESRTWQVPAATLGDPGALFSLLPATLPRERLSPGAVWTRTVAIPLAATPEGAQSARLDATFTFDSVSRSGEYAYIEVRGRLEREGAARATAEGGRLINTAGEVTGRIVLDRHRGWISEARSVVTLHSVVTPSKRGRGEPPGMRSRVKITQWMRVL
jgi:hypothetical protein